MLEIPAEGLKLSKVLLRFSSTSRAQEKGPGHKPKVDMTSLKPLQLFTEDQSREQLFIGSIVLLNHAKLLMVAARDL